MWMRSKYGCTPRRGLSDWDRWSPVVSHGWTHITDKGKKKERKGVGKGDGSGGVFVGRGEGDQAG